MVLYFYDKPTAKAGEDETTEVELKISDFYVENEDDDYAQFVGTYNGTHIEGRLEITELRRLLKEVEAL